MFNFFKNKSDTQGPVSYFKGTIEAVYVAEESTFSMTHVETGIVWETTISQLTQLLTRSYDENNKQIYDSNKDTNLVTSHKKTYRGSFPLELILLQLLGFSVSVIDSRCYARCPGTKDFYFTVRHASQIPGIENYVEIPEADAA
jgi:hypothetical protein